jgi:hypothetical protein
VREFTAGRHGRNDALRWIHVGIWFSASVLTMADARSRYDNACLGGLVALWPYVRKAKRTAESERKRLCMQAASTRLPVGLATSASSGANLRGEEWAAGEGIRRACPADCWTGLQELRLRLAGEGTAGRESLSWERLGFNNWGSWAKRVSLRCLEFFFFYFKAFFKWF